MMSQQAASGASDESAARAQRQTRTVAVSDSPFRDALESRRARLLHVVGGTDAHHDVRRLLAEVDAALARLQEGTFGVCETCHQPIEADRLVRDPLVRLCSDHPGEGEATRLSRDLALARTVQRRLLPPPQTVIPGWRFHYRYAAAADVGGDYLDVIDTPQRGSTLVLLGDVSGKGVAASMLVSHLHATFRSLAPLAADTGDMLARANDLFLASAPGSAYATLLVAELHPDGALSLYDAGHCPPLVLRDGRAETLATEGGLPLGMFAGSRYVPTRLSLGPGDAVLLYTDGASEARDGVDGEFGRDGLEQAMIGAPVATPFDIVETCFDRLRRFAAGARAHDDLTLLALATR